MRYGPYTGPSVSLQFRLYPDEAGALAHLAALLPPGETTADLVRKLLDHPWATHELQRGAIDANCQSTYDGITPGTRTRLVVRVKLHEAQRWRAMAADAGLPLKECLSAAIAHVLRGHPETLALVTTPTPCTIAPQPGPPER